jgi:hypothetical protein
MDKTTIRTTEVNAQSLGAFQEVDRSQRNTKSVAQDQALVPAKACAVGKLPMGSMEKKMI